LPLGERRGRQVHLQTYSPVSDTAKWRERQSAISKACGQLFDHHIGVEYAIFQDCMSMTSEAFEELLMPGVMSTFRERVAHGISCHAYQLLLSAWGDLRAGRLAAACSHWRSIWEAPDYLLAAAFNEDFACTWADPERNTTVKVARARRIVRNELNRRKAGAGDDRARRHEELEKGLHALSHVSVDMAVMTFLPGQGGSFAVPEGAFTPAVKQHSELVALLARDLMAAMGVAFEHLLSAGWKPRSYEAFRRAKDAFQAASAEQSADDNR
jgi:hypothetical protein